MGDFPRDCEVAPGDRVALAVDVGEAGGADDPDDQQGGTRHMVADAGGQ